MPLATTELSLDAFAPLVNECFTLHLDAATTVAIRLSVVTPSGWNTPSEKGGRQSFSMVFHAPADAPISQGVYPFTHPQLGTHALFLVPVSRDARGLGLEVIFNFA